MYLRYRGKEDFVWIGLQKGDTEPCDCSGNVTECEICRDTWIWYDGTSMTYVDWYNRRPFGGQRFCGLLRSGGKFDASTCENEDMFPYICQCALTVCNLC